MQTMSVKRPCVLSNNKIYLITTCCLHILKLKSDTTVWIEKWPLSKEKLEALTQLVSEQLQLGNVEPSLSPWNSPVFLVKKKSGKWRIVTDLRVIYAVIKPMGAIQSGMPAPALIPKNWPLIVIDLKDWFFSYCFT